MPTSSLNRSAAALGVAVALLAGCGGSQPPVAAPGAMPHTPAIATHAERGGSWMLPEAKSGDPTCCHPKPKLVNCKSVEGTFLF